MMLNLIKPSLARIILIFAASPGRKWQRNEIKETTGMNNVPLDNSLNTLLTLKLICENKRMYSLNLENYFVQQIVKEIKETISNLPFQIQFIVIDIIESISKLKKIKNIILFGSYSKLIFTDKSDLDIAIITEHKNPKLKEKVFLLTEKLSKKYKKQVHEQFFTEQDLKHKEDPLVKDILRNGIPLI